MDKLKEYSAYNGLEDLSERRKAAVSIEGKIFMAEKSEIDYLWRIWQELVTMETEYQKIVPNSGRERSSNDPAGSSATMRDILDLLEDAFDGTSWNNMTTNTVDVVKHLISGTLLMRREKVETESLNDESAMLSRHLMIVMKALVDENKYLKNITKELTTENNKLTSDIVKMTTENNKLTSDIVKMTKLRSHNNGLEQALYTEESHNSPLESHSVHRNVDQPFGDVEMEDTFSDIRLSCDDESASKDTGFLCDLRNSERDLTEFLKKLEADVTSDVKSSDFSGLEGEQKEFGRYKFPLSLIPVVERISKVYGDVSTNAKINPLIAEGVYVRLCAVIKEMDDLQLGEITDDRMLKWRDVINDALRLNFNVRFAMEHLKKIARAYFGLKPFSELESVLECYEGKRKLIDSIYGTQKFVGVPVSTGLFGLLIHDY